MQKIGGGPQGSAFLLCTQVVPGVGEKPGAYDLTTGSEFQLHHRPAVGIGATYATSLSLFLNPFQKMGIKRHLP